MLLLVRHGRTQHNATRRLLGRLDVPLDELGIRQATALGRVEVIQHAARVIASPLTRTRETADLLGPPVTVDGRWAEIDYGIYDGLPLDEVPASVWDHWRADPTWVPEGGESMAGLGVRVRQACDDLWAEASEVDVVVVSHVSPIKAAVAWALGCDDRAASRMFLDVASLTRVGVGRNGPSLRSFNESHHRPSA